MHIEILDLVEGAEQARRPEGRPGLHVCGDAGEFGVGTEGARPAGERAETSGGIGDQLSALGCSESARCAGERSALGTGARRPLVTPPDT